MWVSTASLTLRPPEPGACKPSAVAAPHSSLSLFGYKYCCFLIHCKEGVFGKFEISLAKIILSSLRPNILLLWC